MGHRPITSTGPKESIVKGRSRNAEALARFIASMALSCAVGGVCAQSAPVFDGEIIVSPKGIESLPVAQVRDRG